MFTGKGGVGKTSLAAATSIKLAALNYRTLVMSIDPAHSLGDSFDLETDLFHLQTSDPLEIFDCPLCRFPSITRSKVFRTSCSVIALCITVASRLRNLRQRAFSQNCGPWRNSSAPLLLAMMT